MKKIYLFIVGLILSNAGLANSDPIGEIRFAPGAFSEFIASGHGCIGPNGAYSIGAIIQFDGREFSCEYQKVGDNRHITGWVEVVDTPSK